MAYQVLYRRRAERDLDKLAEATTLDSFGGLVNALESSRKFPERCAYAPDPGLRHRGVRQLLYGEGRSIYRILYRIKDDSVQVLTIRHTHRKPLDK